MTTLDLETETSCRRFGLSEAWFCSADVALIGLLAVPWQKERLKSLLLKVSEV